MLCPACSSMPLRAVHKARDTGEYVWLTGVKQGKGAGIPEDVYRAAVPTCGLFRVMTPSGFRLAPLKKKQGAFCEVQAQIVDRGAKMGDEVVKRSPVVARAAYALFTLAIPYNWAVALLFWALEYGLSEGTIYPLTILLHGVNMLVIFVDCAANRQPFKFARSLLITEILGNVYMLSSVVFSFSGLTNSCECFDGVDRPGCEELSTEPFSDSCRVGSSKRPALWAHHMRA